MNQGYVKASSETLPNVDLDMLIIFLAENECFSSPELKNVKTVRNMRSNYGDQAVGYVQLLRQQNYCTVEAKVCPEHRNNSKNYTVIVKVDEVEEFFVQAQCQDCTASQGGCKHAVAFIAWLYRKSQEPPPTSVECYWEKPMLSRVAAKYRYITMENLLSADGAPIQTDSEDTSDEFLRLVLNAKQAQNSEGHLFKLYRSNPVQKLSLHYLSVKYNGDRGNISDFLYFCSEVLTPENCDYVSKLTTDQSNSKSWYELRYARMSASVIWECAHCKAHDGSLVQKIFLNSTIDTSAMKRGRELEPFLLPKISQLLQEKYGEESAIRRTGFRMNKEYPVIGASPDGETDHAVVELKCPSKEKTVKNYFEGNIIKSKFRAQIQLQMFFANKKKGYFCVASPNVEKDNKVKIIVEPYDENFIKGLLEDAMIFWREAIFPKLMKQVL